jgi:manganese transport system substrate-binding protein
MPKSRIRHTKLFLTLSVAVVALPLLSACSAPGVSADSGKPVVLTTFTVLEDIAQNVAGDHLDVQSITKRGAEIHGYEPTPADVRKASTADLILDNGLGLEKWFEQFVASSDAPHVTVSEGVETIASSEGAAEGLDNPHAWMSAVNASIYVDNIADAFVQLDPANADNYRANATAYQAELDTVHIQLTAALETIPQSARALVTCEGAFSYLARDAGLDEQYLWAVNAESEATPQSLAATIDFVSDREVPAVFCESTVSDQTQRQVASQSGSDFGGVLYVDSLSADDGPVPTFLDLLRHDANTIVTGLRGESE